MKTKVVVELAENWLKVVVGRKITAEPLAAIEPAAISTALSLVLKQNKCGKDLEVFVVLSRNKITVRRVDLPSHDTKEIEQMLGLYLVRQIPYQKEEVCWAYQNLGFDGVSNSHLILGVVLKNIFKNIVNSFGQVNILPEAILMSSQGLIHYVSDVLKDKLTGQSSYLILDIDANYSDLILVYKQKLGSSVVIIQGVDQLKNAPDKDKFGAELKAAIVALNNEIPVAKPEKIFLTGAAAGQLSFIENLVKDFGLSAQYVSSREYDGFNAGGAKGISLSAVLGFSAAIAKEDMRFVIPELQIKKEMKTKVQQLMILGICLVYILIMLGAISLASLIKKQSYAAGLKTKVEQLFKQAKDLEDITNKLKVIKQYVNPKSSVLSTLVELSRFSPESIVITNFNWEWQKSLSFKGYAQQISEILNFTNTLNNSEAFKGAQNRYTRRRKIKDKEVVDFEIVVK